MAYTDHVGDLVLTERTKRICDELEEQGWTCTAFIAGRGLRFVCPQTDDCKHAQLWIDPVFVSPGFLDSAFQRTCLRHFTP
jgi:hypothetical protein